MRLSYSELGALANSSSGGRGDDEDRRRRLEAAISIIRTRPGRVSEDGVERICRRSGLEVLWEDRRKDGSRQLTIAGQTVLLDIDFKDSTVDRVALTFPGSSNSVTQHTESAARILQDDLTPPKWIARMNWKLDRFSGNLELLAKLDKLSTSPEQSCFEAIGGIYNSLRQLFEHEKKTTLSLMGPNRTHAEVKAEREVLCRKSGRPRMNVSNRIGLSLEYWMDNRYVLNQSPHPEPSSNDTQIYSLLIECDPAVNQLYPPLRISSSWLSPNVFKPSSAADLLNTPQIDWLDPPPTYIPPNQNEVQTGLLEGKLPKGRFVAKLHPPLVVPLIMAQNISSMSGGPLQQESMRLTTVEGLLLRPDEKESDIVAASLTAGPPKPTATERMVLAEDSVEGRNYVERTHTNSLFLRSAEYGRVVEEIAFEHPRQLVEILPTLRQYAFLRTLVLGTFGPSDDSTAAESSEKLLPRLPPLSVDVSLTTNPAPNLTVVFPVPGREVALFPDKSVLKQGSLLPTSNSDITLESLLTPPWSSSDHDGTQPALITIALSILPNAEVEVTDQNVYPAPNLNLNGTGKRKEGQTQKDEVERLEKVRRLGRALEVAGNTGLWVEWVGRESRFARE
ncbi:hypothetical protein M501DRAFT_931923 [Patellaria atrata CBS 101060]|uniref:Mediator of RNA polymerase II transcription subunit 1 n=1 Tax=Patellaria atrata CBS 101060 TaxID=1346257 RepID=A0A9P4VS24_9PEZI|nr:hypothetical protein M501DRAFT_931923 [Patellaria atrata CBS 101060]